jgi:hypothetical protein
VLLRLEGGTQPIWLEFEDAGPLSMPEEQMDTNLVSEDDSNLLFFFSCRDGLAAMEDGPFLLSCSSTLPSGANFS